MRCFIIFIIWQVSHNALCSAGLRLRAMSATYWLTLTVRRTLPDAGPGIARLANRFDFHGLGKPVKYSVVKSSDSGERLSWVWGAAVL